MADLSARLILSLVDRFSAPGRRAAGVLGSILTEGRKLAGLRSVAAGVTSVGRGMTRLGSAGRRALGGLFGVAIDFEQEMANLRSVFFSLGSEDMARLQEKAREMGRETKFSAIESAQGMTLLAQAGLGVGDVLIGIDRTLNLAAAGNLGLAAASDIATDVMKQFGLQASDIGRVSDVLTVGSQSATTNVQQLGQGLSKIGPLAAQYGISLEQATAFTAAFADVGLKGGVGGRSFRRVLLQLIAPSDKAREALRRLGVVREDVARGPIAVITKIAEAQKRIKTDEDRVKFLSRLANAFGAFGVGGAAAAAADFAKGLDQVDENGESVVDILKILNRGQNAVGRSADVAARRMDTTRGDVLRAKAAIEGLAIELADLQIPREFLQTVTDTVRGIIEWAKQNPELAKGLIKVAIGGVAIASVFGPLITVGGGMLAMFVQWRLAAKLLGGSLVGGAGLKGALAALATPTGAIVGLVLAAAAGLAVLRSRVDALRRSSVGLQTIIGANAPRVAKKLDDAALQRRAAGLEARAQQEQRRREAAERGRGLLARVGDSLIGRKSDRTVETGLRAEAAVLREELDRRRKAPEDQRLRAQVDVNLKVDQLGRVVPQGVTSSDADVSATLSSGLQMAGAGA